MSDDTVVPNHIDELTRLRADLAAARADVARLKDELAIAGEIAREALAATATPPVVPLVDAEALAMALEQLAQRARYHVDCQPARVAIATFHAKHPKP